MKHASFLPLSLSPLSRQLVMAGMLTTALVSTDLIINISYADSVTQQQSFNIQAGSLESALNQFAVQSGITVSFSPDVVAGIQTDRFQGAVAPSTLITQLLADTGLQATLLANGSYSISKKPAPVAVTPKQKQSVELDDMLITSTRSDTQLKDSPQVVTVINRAQIEQQMEMSSDTSQILSNLLPSFSPSRQKLTSGGETFRGRSPLFLIDGVPQSNPLRDGQRDGHTIDMSMVERVEVIHGASAIHGLGATGGIINFITRRPSQDTLKQSLNVQMTTPTGEFGDETSGYRSDYNLSGSKNDFEYTLGLSYERQGVFLDADGTEIGVDNVQGDIMNSKSYDLFTKLGYWINDDQHIEASLNRYQVKGGNDYVSVDGDIEKGEPTTSVRGTPVGDAPYNRVLTTSLKYQNYDLAGMEFTAQAYRQEFEALFGALTSSSFYEPTLAPDSIDQTQIESVKKGAKFTLVKDGLLDDKLKVTTGFDLLEDSSSQNLAMTNRSYVPEVVYKNYAPFLQLQLQPIEAVVLHAGVRYEHSELDVDDFTTVYGKGAVDVKGGNPDFSETLFNGGVVISPLSWLSVFANYSEGFGMPDVGRVLREVSVAGTSVDGLLDLEPIITTNREVGIRLNWDSIDFEVSYYESDSDLGSRLSANADNTQYMVNREKQEINGAEANLGWKVNDEHKLNLAYSYIRGRYDSDGDGKVDTDLNGQNIPPNRLIASWQAEWTPKLTSFVQASYNFDRNFDEEAGDDEEQFKAYGLIDATMAYKLSTGKIHAGVTNLLNKDYFSYSSQTSYGSDTRNFKGRGRTLTIGYSLDF
ncbi:TonB-dependent receptor [Methylophaga thalassica]|uniref:TonB-dependent receptor n=1 Tax=Methylophaga thalassica TaxID=40223 RepID=UPI002E7BF1B9|nr:TonB-dependent receptor [Methylophaga thalassica]WVI85428.1 TonB-dependent receptor [Methylophaga thalassica]